MDRVDNWQKALNDFIQSRMDTPFQWGTNDCCMFAGDAVEAITGVDVMAPFRGKYTTEDESKEVLAGKRVKTLVTKILGKPVHWSRLQRGDIAMFEQETGKTLGVCIGDSLATPSEFGLRFTKLDKSLFGWKV